MKTISRIINQTRCWLNPKSHFVPNRICTLKFLPFLVGYIFTCVNSYAQFTVGDDAIMAGGSGQILTIDSSLVNHGIMDLHSDFTLYLTEEGVLITDDVLMIPNLTLNAIHFDVEGEILIEDTLDFQQGTLAPTSNGKITIMEEGVATSMNGSHVNGLLYHTGNGYKFYPIGVNDKYAPVTLIDNVGDNDLVVGVEVRNEDLGLTELPDGVSEASHDWYWVMDVTGEYEGSKIVLPVLLEDSTLFSGSSTIPTIVEADEFLMETTDLGSQYVYGDETLESEENAKKKYVLLGFIPEVNPLIHNIITLGDDESNPYLIIDNIEVLGDNIVTLIDRWGNVVYEKKDFKNFNDEDQSYNGEFDDLPSGNYVCLLKSRRETISQMVTIIKN